MTAGEIAMLVGDGVALLGFIGASARKAHALANRFEAAAAAIERVGQIEGRIGELERRYDAHLIEHHTGPRVTA